MMKDPMRRRSIMELESPKQEQGKGSQNNTVLVKNFRQARGLINIYRCAKMDDLADRFDDSKQDKPASWSGAEGTILCRAGLILDLRSPSEIKQEKISKWTEHAPGGKILVMREENHEDALLAKEKRVMLNIDVLGPKDFSKYVERKWLTSAQEQIQMTFYRAVDGDKLHEMRVEALNKRGLVGLNEVILESGKAHFCRALKAITVHLEKKGGDLFRPVIIHCAQGKDRTGMLVMLLQSIIGVSDQDIIGDYNESEAMVDINKLDETREPGKLDRAMMRRAPKRAMAQTLRYLRDKYGSVSPGYLQAIGFDDSWRLRLVTALLLDMDRPKKSRRKLRGSRL